MFATKDSVVELAPNVLFGFFFVGLFEQHC